MHHPLFTNLIAASAPHAEHAAEAATDPSAAGPALQFVASIGVGILVVGILLCLYRMIKGPHLADRVLAGDTMAMLVAGLVVVLAVKYGTSMFYDAALVVSILGFASTVAFAQYIGAKNKTCENDTQPPTPPGDNAADTAAGKEVSA